MRIGIIELPKKRNLSNYVRWIELSGATAVIIPYSITAEELTSRLHELNGVVWTGGAIESNRYSETERTTYVTTIQNCFRIVTRYNNAGRNYPIWGTCQGMELLMLMNTVILPEHFYDYIQSHPKHGKEPIVFTPKSRMKQWFPAKLRHDMSTTPCTTHHHKLGFDIKTYPHIRIVSVGSDYVNMIEYINYPYYGVQFHPERTFSPFSKEISYQFSLFLNHECQKN